MAAEFADEGEEYAAPERYGGAVPSASRDGGPTAPPDARADRVANTPPTPRRRDDGWLGPAASIVGSSTTHDARRPRDAHGRTPTALRLPEGGGRPRPLMMSRRVPPVAGAPGNTARGRTPASPAPPPQALAASPEADGAVWPPQEPVTAPARVDDLRLLGSPAAGHAGDSPDALLGLAERRASLVDACVQLTITLSACPAVAGQLRGGSSAAGGASNSPSGSLLSGQAAAITDAPLSPLTPALQERWRALCDSALQAVERAAEGLPGVMVEACLTAQDHRRERCALHYAACGPLEPPSASAWLVRRLLALAPAACVRLDAGGRTPLHLAALHARLELIDHLAAAKPEALLIADHDGRFPADLGRSSAGACELERRLLVLERNMRAELGGGDGSGDVADAATESPAAAEASTPLGVGSSVVESDAPAAAWLPTSARSAVRANAEANRQREHAITSIAEHMTANDLVIARNWESLARLPPSLRRGAAPDRDDETEELIDAATDDASFPPQGLVDGSQAHDSRAPFYRPHQSALPTQPSESLDEPEAEEWRWSRRWLEGESGSTPIATVSGPRSAPLGGHARARPPPQLRDRRTFGTATHTERPSPSPALPSGFGPRPERLERPERAPQRPTSPPPGLASSGATSPSGLLESVSLRSRLDDLRRANALLSWTNQRLRSELASARAQAEIDLDALAAQQASELDADAAIDQRLASASAAELRELAGRVSAELERRADTGTCGVCLAPFRNPAALCCGHVFCEECVVTALVHRDECPTCRAEALPEDICRLYGLGREEREEP